MHCRSNSRENTDLRSFHDNWQSETEAFGGWVTGPDTTTIENELLKKGEWLRDTTKCVIFGSSVTWVLIFFFLFVSFWHHFPSVLSRAPCTFDKVKTHADTLMCKELGRASSSLPVNEHLAGSEESRWRPNPRRWRRHVQFSCSVWLVCFSVPLCWPAVPIISDSRWPIQAAQHSDQMTGWLKTWCLGWRRSGWYQTPCSRWAPALGCISTAVVQYWSMLVVPWSQTWAVH